MIVELLYTPAFEVPVWRLEIDETKDTLFVELRDTVNKQVSFAGIDLSSGKMTFTDRVMPERWLSGMEAVHHGVLLIHGYQSDNIPLHRGLTAINGHTGELLWSDFNLNFEGLTPNGFAVYDSRILPKKLFVINQATGERVDSIETLQANNSASSIIFPKLLQPPNLPASLLPLQPYQNAVHYLHHNKYRIVSLHAFKGSALTQYLYVWDNNDELLFEDAITEDIQKLQPEAFISYKNKLIWLKNRCEVKILNL